LAIEDRKKKTKKGKNVQKNARTKERKWLQKGGGWKKKRSNKKGGGEKRVGQKNQKFMHPQKGLSRKVFEGKARGGKKKGGGHG